MSSIQSQKVFVQYPELEKVAQDVRLLQLCKLLGPSSELRIVGGTVRDALSGVSSQDLDLASNIPANLLEKTLTNAGLRVIPTGLKHNTITVVFSAEHGPVEITTFRGGSDSELGPGTLERDLALRDFTINAMAFDPFEKVFIDPCSGEKDLNGKIIRAVGNARERFAEDPLRIVRMVRFASRSGFSIEKQTLKSARESSSLLKSVSVERIREEFSKILVSDSPKTGLRLLHECDLLSRIAPELLPSVGFEQNKFHKADVFEHTLEVVETTEADLVLRLAALFHDSGKPGTLSIGENGDRHFYLHEVLSARLTRQCLLRLKYPHHIVDAVVCLVRTHMRPIECGPGGIRRLLRDTGEFYPRWRKLKEADTRACKVQPVELDLMLADFDHRVDEVQKGPSVSPLSSLAIDGNDLLAQGFKPGPMIGEILRALHEQVLDDPSINLEDALLARALQFVEEKSNTRNK